MKDVLKFLAKWFGIVLIILFAAWMLTKIWNGVNVACPECPTDSGWTKTDNDTNVVDTPSGDVTFTQEEKVCRFADGYDSYGKVVPSGTLVTGPALVKPDRDRDHALLVMPGAEYTTVETDEVIWLLVGDSACVDSQAIFFSTSETIEN
jgi:hypothetical protein